mmetsp:Transcript_105998/g.316576  ORF Transcript_105998/g.316576 Transcript_105998/m.316576 type:complete len:286 (-) Transcript_105998:58-915(-)
MVRLVTVRPEEPSVGGSCVGLHLRLRKLPLHLVGREDVCRPCERPLAHDGTRQRLQDAAVALRDADVVPVAQRLPTRAEALVEMEVQRHVLETQEVPAAKPDVEELLEAVVPVDWQNDCHLASVHACAADGADGPLVPAAERRHAAAQARLVGDLQPGHATPPRIPARELRQDLQRLPSPPTRLGPSIVLPAAGRLARLSTGIPVQVQDDLEAKLLCEVHRAVQVLQGRANVGVSPCGAGDDPIAEWHAHGVDTPLAKPLEILFGKPVLPVLLDDLSPPLTQALA